MVFKGQFHTTLITDNIVGKRLNTVGRETAVHFSHFIDIVLCFRLFQFEGCFGSIQIDFAQTEPRIPVGCQRRTYTILRILADILADIESGVAYILVVVSRTISTSQRLTVRINRSQVTDLQFVPAIFPSGHTCLNLYR